MYISSFENQPNVGPEEFTDSEKNARSASAEIIIDSEVLDPDLRTELVNIVESCVHNGGKCNISRVANAIWDEFHNYENRMGGPEVETVKAQRLELTTIVQKIVTVLTEDRRRLKNNQAHPSSLDRELQ